jgi:hypothetical protein
MKKIILGSLILISSVAGAFAGNLWRVQDGSYFSSDYSRLWNLLNTRHGTYMYRTIRDNMIRDGVLFACPRGEVVEVISINNGIATLSGKDGVFYLPTEDFGQYLGHRGIETAPSPAATPVPTPTPVVFPQPVVLHDDAGVPAPVAAGFTSQDAAESFVKNFLQQTTGTRETLAQTSTFAHIRLATYDYVVAEIEVNTTLGIEQRGLVYDIKTGMTATRDMDTYHQFLHEGGNRNLIGIHDLNPLE